MIKAYCEYCHCQTVDNSRGNCAACGAPRMENKLVFTSAAQQALESERILGGVMVSPDKVYSSCYILPWHENLGIKGKLK